MYQKNPPSRLHRASLRIPTLNSIRMTDMQNDAVDLFERFIDLYFASVYSAVSRLTGLKDEQAIEAITVDIFVNLWKNSDTLFSEVRPPAFIYKIMLPHIFGYLKEHESEKREQPERNHEIVIQIHSSRKSFQSMANPRRQSRFQRRRQEWLSIYASGRRT